MDIKDDLKRAIDARNTISFDYDGHSRIVEPYHYGKPIMTPQFKYIKKAQEDSLFCYQIGGTSKSNQTSGKPIDFRTMSLSGISNFKINESENFEIRNNYDPKDRRWKIEYGINNSTKYKP